MLSFCSVTLLAPPIKTRRSGWGGGLAWHGVECSQGSEELQQVSWCPKGSCTQVLALGRPCRVLESFREESLGSTAEGQVHSALDNLGEPRK